jgi:hypothetical protein
VVASDGASERLDGSDRGQDGEAVVAIAAVVAAAGAECGGGAEDSDAGQEQEFALHRPPLLRLHLETWPDDTSSQQAGATDVKKTAASQGALM